MTNDRITLALAACEGMTNEDLQKRGAAGFVKMIERKRMYAAAARKLTLILTGAAKQHQALTAQVADMQAKLAIANEQLAQLKSLEAPVDDTTQAASMIAAIAGKAKPDGQ